MSFLFVLFVVIVVFVIFLVHSKKKKIHFVTLVDKESVYKCENLKKSLHGDLIILDTYDHSIGNFSKLFQFREFLKNDTRTRDDDILCFIDAFDILCLKYDPKGVEDAFKKYNKRLIIGSEENCGPEHTQQAARYFRERYGPECYLNGGFQIGYKSEFIKMHDYIYENFEELKSNLEINRNTEQGIISQVYMREIFDIGLDTDCTLVNNWGPERELRTHLDSFFIHVIRADTNAKKFQLTPELEEHYEKYRQGLIKYDKHIDMIERHKTFEEQTERYKKILSETNL